MPTQVELSDGRIAEFPGEMSQDDILSALRREFPSDKPSADLGSNINQSPLDIPFSSGMPYGAPPPIFTPESEGRLGMLGEAMREIPEPISQGLHYALKPFEYLAANLKYASPEDVPINPEALRVMEQFKAEPGKSIFPGLEPPEEDRGVIPSLRRFAAGSTTPGMFLVAPFAPASRIATGAFALGAAASIPPSIAALTEATTPAEARGALTDITLASIVARAAGKSALSETPRFEKGGEPNAIQREAETVLRDVQQPEVPQEGAGRVPADEGRAQAPQARQENVAPPEQVGDFVYRQANQIGAIRLEGLTDAEIAALRAAQPNQLEYTDQLKGSPSEGATVYLQEGATKEQIATRTLERRADEFVPALKTKDGNIIIGERGRTHNDIYTQLGKIEGAELRMEQPEHGFYSNTSKQFYSRSEASKWLNQTDPLQSEKLAELQTKPKGGVERGLQEKGTKEEVTPTAPVTEAPELAPATAGAIAQTTPLTPAQTSPLQVAPKAQRQIIADISKGLNIPIRFGNLTTRKFAGYFKQIPNLIGAKKAVDVPTVSHEVGHKLDSTFSLSSDASIAAELDVLGDPATPGSGSSWTKSKSKKYKMGEGVAEFVRYWMTDPQKAQQMAPNTARLFEAALDANKDFGDVMRQAQSDIRTWRESQPQARLRSHISTSNPNKTRYGMSQLTRDLVDDLHMLRLAVEHAKKRTGISPSNDAYVLARNLRGSYGMASTFIRDGIADFNTKEVRLGTSLEDALKPVGKRLDDFRDWIVAKRAQELRAQGKETGLVPSDVDAVASKFNGDPIFEKAFDNIKAWNDALLKYAVDSGLLSPEGAQAMRAMNQDYVPFHRFFEIGAGESPSQQAMGIGGGLNVGKPGSLRGLKGSVRPIIDPLETMVKNAYVLITASEKASIGKAVADMANMPDMGRWVERVSAPAHGERIPIEDIRKQLGSAGADLTNVPNDLIISLFRIGGPAPFGENIIRVLRQGKPEYYRLNKDLYDTFSALDLEDSSKLIRILSAPAQLLRAGVVLDPSFNVFNILRDTFSSAVIGKYGAYPFETTFKGIAAMLSNPKAIAEWAASGGKSAVEASYFDRAKLQRYLTERISKDLSPAERAMIVAKSPLTALRYLTSLAEEATRIGEYQTAYKKLIESGMPEGDARRMAGFEARDRQDFAKGGAKTKIIRHMAAFWNASLQANVKLAQAFKQRPVRTTLQGLAFVTIPKLLEQAVNWDDEDYWKRQQWERDLFFLIPIGKDDTGHTRFLRIPVPFEVGIIFATFPGRLLEWMKKNRPDAVTTFPSMMLKQSVPNPLPQSAQMIFEDFLSGKQGWDVWRGRTIVPDSLAAYPPDLQWTEQTSGFAKKIGQTVNFSPMKIDHMIERTTGGLGKLATGRTALGQRFVTAPLRFSNQAMTDFYDLLEQMRGEEQRSKTSADIEPPEKLKSFERGARQISKLRDEARQTSDEKLKTALEEEIFSIASSLVEDYRKSNRTR